MKGIEHLVNPFVLSMYDWFAVSGATKVSFIELSTYGSGIYM